MSGQFCTFVMFFVVDANFCFPPTALHPRLDILDPIKFQAGIKRTLVHFFRGGLKAKSWLINGDAVSLHRLSQRRKKLKCYPTVPNVDTAPPYWTISTLSHAMCIVQQTLNNINVECYFIIGPLGDSNGGVRLSGGKSLVDSKLATLHFGVE